MDGCWREVGEAVPASLLFDGNLYRWVRALACGYAMAFAACTHAPGAPGGHAGSVAPMSIAAGSSGNAAAPTAGSSPPPTAGSQSQPPPSMDAGRIPGSAGSGDWTAMKQAID